MPILATLFSAAGVIGGYIVGVVLIGVDDESVLVANAGRCRYLERYRQWRYQKPGFRIRGNIHGPVPGI